MSVITALEIQKKNKQRVNVYLDGVFAFGLNLMAAAGLKKGQALSETEISRLRAEDTVQQAVDSAAHFLSYRPRSRQEMRRNLAEKEFDSTVIEAALDRLTQMGYLDDVAFARFWTQNRADFKPLSHRALRQELRQKGIADPAIDEALSQLDESGMADQAARSQVRKLRNSTPRVFRAKLSAFLMRRGFSYDTTEDAVNRLMDELADDPQYFNRSLDNEE